MFLRLVFSVFLAVTISWKAAGKPLFGKATKFIRWDEQNLFQGDIEIPRKTRNALLSYSSRKWPNGIVYYDYSEFEDWSQEHTDLLNKALQMIERHTCIKFVKRSSQENYINIVNGNGCSSEIVGMTGSAQRLSLMTVNDNNATCWGTSTLIHELLHAIGLWHEQSRYDRDDYVDMHPENMGGADFQFQKIYSNVSSTYGVPYNYKSIMHYTAYAFSSNKQPTITPRQAGVSISDLGHGEVWDYELDWEKVRRMYNCQGTYPLEACDDTYQYCDQYKYKCTYPDEKAWITSSCPRTCGLCPSGSPTTNS